MLYRQSQPVVVWCWMAVHRICYKVIIRTITDIAAPNPSQFTDYCNLWGTERKWQVLVPSVGCSVQTNDICNLLRSQSYPEYYNCMVSSNHGYKKKKHENIAWHRIGEHCDICVVHVKVVLWKGPIKLRMARLQLTLESFIYIYSYMEILSQLLHVELSFFLSHLSLCFNPWLFQVTCWSIIEQATEP